MTELVYARTKIIADLSKELEEVVNAFAGKSKGGISYTELVLACTFMQKVYDEELKDLWK